MDDIQSWWEVPSIAHFCSLFRVAFNLLDFDIEELEEALLTDGTELNGSSLLQDLIVRLLSGCLGHNDISTFNYQMFLRRLFRTKCKEQGRENPFNTDMDFQFLPLRTKVEILHTLCDFRLDADDVIDVLKNLDSDSLRVHPLGYDENRSAYWYFYGTRLYKEEYPKKRKKKKDDKIKKKKKDESSEEEDEPGGGSWKVMCYTEEDWQKLADSLAGSTCKEERILHTVLSEDFLPEIPRLFEEKERLQKKRLENQPRRQSRRIEKLKHQQHEKDVKTKKDRYYDREVVNREKYLQRVKKSQQDREKRAMKRSLSRSSDDCASSETGNILPTGRQTNNSLSSATGAIIIKPPTTKQKFNTSQLFKRTREDLMTGMYKILDRVKAHDDSWPFRDPVDEAYAPRYYAVIARPMDLQTMEDKLDNGEYGSLQEFRADFQLIVDNCRQYNGSSNEYTEMAMNMQQLFEASIERYLDVEHSSDDEPPRLSHNLEEMDDLDDDSLGSSLTPLMNGPRSRSLSSISNGTISDQESHSSYSRRLPTQNETRHKRKVKRRKKTYKDDLSSMDDDSRGSVLSSPARKAKPKKDKSSRDTSLDRSKDRSETSLERIRPKINYNEQYSSQSDLYSDSTQSDDSFADKLKNKQAKKTVKKAGIIKNVEALEALELATEQTLRDINRWLDDTPKFSDFSSNSNSPLHNPFPEEMASMEGEYRRRLQIDRPMRPRDRFSNDLHRRRLFKEQMGLKRRKEIQRTIDRLQPGKSKGNLLNKDHMQDSSNAEPKPVDETNDNAPKISLGKVLETGALGFGMGESKKDSEDDCAEDKLVIEEDEPEEKPKEEEEPKEVKVPEEKKTVEPEKKEKPTPNLSAWFKAFGAPKTQPVSKKKPEETTERKKDEEEEEKKEEPARRQRKASTGSSVSERSSFSQEPIDGNSPRPSLDEPYLSPQQEVAKPYHHSPINGTIKVGFYQDTCFPRGTSEKSGSPRDLPSCSPRDPNAYQSPRDYNSPRYNQSPNDYNSPQPSPYQEAPQDYKYREEYSTPSYSGVPSYPSHLSYYDNKKTHYPVKKRGYNEIEKPESPSSFTPTREAVEQERTFTPTPGRIPGPSQPLRVPDIHPLQHHILDLEERHLPSTYYSDSFGKPVSPHIYSQPTNYSMNEQRERTSPVINYAKPSSPTTLPLNFSNCDKAEAREETIVNTPGLAYGKVTERTSPYREMIPPKVNSPFNRIPEIPRVNYPGQDLSKLYNQQEYMKYNHQIELMQNRYNYSDLNKYNYNMMPTNLSNYNRIPEIMNKPEIPPEVVYAPRNVPVNKPETKAKKKKKKDSGFQQYVAPPSEPISLKTSVPGSAFNFGPPIKEGYGYLDEIRPYYPPENKNAPHSSSYFLPPTPARASYPHPFMNSQYQQLLHRHPDELLRPMVLHHQSLIPPPAGYPPGYIMHDPINRHSWL